MSVLDDDRDWTGSVEYLDFELEISARPEGGYTTRVLQSPAGNANGTMDFPLDALVLENRIQALQLALIKSGRGRRRLELPEAQLVRQFGAELWKSLFVGDVLSRFDVSREMARSRDRGLRIKLRVNVPEVAALPWEFLYDERRNAYLTLSTKTPLVRYTALSEPIQPLAVVPPLRVLGMIADPKDLDPLDVGRERERLERALARLREHRLVDLQWVPDGTWRALKDTLRHGPWHIFHFIGHGGFDEDKKEGILALVDEDGRAHRLLASELAILLEGHLPLRLAVLNSCDSARADTTDVFSSTALALIQKGTPAVVAMQYEITDLAAIEFSRSFYEAIADSVPVDTAVAEARQGVAVSISGTLEWGTPVLFSQAPDGVLFSIPPERVASTVIDRSAGVGLGDRSGFAAVWAHLRAALRPSRAALARWSRGRRRIVPLGLATLVVAAAIGFALLPRGAIAAVSLSAASIAQGETVRLAGTGYAPGEKVNIIIAGTVRASVVSDTAGAFSIPLVFSDTPGSLDIQAVGASSGRVAHGSLSLMMAAASPSASPSAAPWPSGSPAPSGSASGSPEPSLPPSAASTPRPTVHPTIPPTPVPTLRVTPEPTPTLAPVLIVDRSVVLSANGELDTDSGVVTSANADVWFEHDSDVVNYLVPENGGKVGFFGATAPGYAGCSSAAVGTSPIALGSANVGDYLCVRSGAGLVSQLQLEDLTDTMTLRVKTWQ